MGKLTHEDLGFLDENFKRFGMTGGSRVLTDHQNGRTDRVVWEWEVASLGALETLLDQGMSTPEAQAFFGQWFQKLTTLIERAEVENWSIQ